MAKKNLDEEKIEMDNTNEKEKDNEKDREIELLKKQLEELKKVKEKTFEEVDDREYIKIRSISNGTVSYLNNRNGAKFFWKKMGDIQRIRAEEVRVMNSLYPKYFEDYILVIDDERMINELNLNYLYEDFDLSIIDNLDKLFEKPIEVIRKKIMGLPDFISKLMKETIIKSYFDNKITDLAKIRFLCESFKINFEELEKDRLYREKTK